MVLDALSQLVGGDRPDHTLGFGQIAIRATVIYLAAVVLVRLGKSRLLSGATPVDGVLTFLLGAIFGGAIVGTVPMSRAVVAVATLVALHWASTAAAFRYKRWGQFFKGNAYVLVSDGRINWDNMRRSTISEDDLFEQLRLNANINDVGEVQLAVKERSGSVSAVKKPSDQLQFDIEVKDGVQTVRIVLRSSDTSEPRHEVNRT